MTVPPILRECDDWTITPGLRDEAWVHCSHPRFGELVTFGTSEAEALDKMGAALREARARLGADATCDTSDDQEAA